MTWLNVLLGAVIVFGISTGIAVLVGTAINRSNVPQPDVLDTLSDHEFFGHVDDNGIFHPATAVHVPGGVINVPETLTHDERDELIDRFRKANGR